ncbi:MAG: hypothetical protein VKJ24_11900 [Synechococcales bacterium]|nr:hypothetical protein [Synechococcales bacterium]
MARLNAWVQSSESDPSAPFLTHHCVPTLFSETCADRSTSEQPLGASKLFLLNSIPPERVGIHGEYDHQGLAKRVKLAFQEQLGLTALTNLRISQRGRVVILMGKVLNYTVLCRMVGIAQSVDGTAFVETDGVNLLESLPA